MRSWMRVAVALTTCSIGGAGSLALHAGARQVDSLFDRREVMIPGRDGTKLFTVILTPKGGGKPLPILLMRTPYGARKGASGAGGAATDALRADGYHFVFQDIRGRYQSDGTFVMNRPPCPQRGPGCVDESTDTWDAIEWLVKNVPRNNGRVGALGISYPGWLTDMAAIEPHPALKAISPQAPMGDTWMGDDFFHQGAFRLSYTLEYSWSMEASRDESVDPAPGRYDTYDWYRSFPTLGALAKAVGADAWPTWRRVVAHPSYDEEWQARSVPVRLRTPTVPILTVGGWWDQEDLYGPLATYATFEQSDTEGRNHLAMGPWSHGQWASDSGEALGQLHFGTATGDYFRAQIQAKWFRKWLHGDADARFPEATLFDAGLDEWQTFDSWPPKDATSRPLFFRDGGQLSFDAPDNTTGSDQYLSDPAHPVPYRSRPVEWTYDPRGSRWAAWMTEDQRLVEGRPDVLVWQTPPLTGDVRLAGSITAKLFASTTGSDADWVVKLIDVYPDSVADRPRMGGYQLMVAGDIMRGRYHRGWSRPEALQPDVVTPFTVDLHQQSYTFRKGHRIMVQVQSTWFPLYDRNPQTFVPNIFEAPPSAYRAQTHTIYRTKDHPSHVEIQVR
jgi:uncharacterized protein